jgi:hypothetical protein
MPLDGKVKRIQDMLDSLSSALSLRQRRLYPETPLRDWSLDFRSNFIQIILCAEAAIKAAAGILRKIVRGDESERDTLGVVHHITFEEGISAISADFSLGTESGGPRLAIFASDIAHLTHVPGYADFFHEGFHLIYDDCVKKDLVRRIGDEKKEGRRPLHGQPTEVAEKRFSEYFVHLLMQLFVFDGDWRLALRQHAITFSTSMSSAFPNPRGVRRSFLENFGPIFVACLVTDVAKTKAEKQGNAHFHSQTLDPEVWKDLSEASVFFEEALTAIMPCLADKGWIFDEKDIDPLGNGRLVPGRTLVLQGLMRHYAEYFDFLTILWSKASKIHAMFVARILYDMGDNPHPQKKIPSMQNPCDVEPKHYAAFDTLRKRLDGIIENTQVEGEPGYAPVIAARIVPGYCVDATLLACRTLYHCMKEMEDLLDGDETDRVRFLPRNAADGHIALNPAHRYSRMLMDRTATHLFSCVPEARRRRTGLQIATLKTFWDIASRNRARRLISLLEKAGRAKCENKSAP